MNYFIKKIVKILYPKNLVKGARKLILFLRTRRLNELWSDQNYILKYVDIAQAELPSFLHSVPQAEHQIGRYRQIKKISEEILENRFEGDILEFGTWQGLGVILLLKSFGQDLGNRKVIGIDSFKGLPVSSSIWQEGQFSNTSMNQAKLNIQEFAGKESNFVLIEGSFNEPQTQEILYKTTNSVAMVHFDADLGTSTHDALMSIEKFLLNRKSPMFFLFDDWGNHPDEVPDAFYKWLKQQKNFITLMKRKLVQQISLDNTG